MDYNIVTMRGFISKLLLSVMLGKELFPDKSYIRIVILDNFNV